eukprot:COSAG02_NODE_7610_length_2935_cov_3.495063_2_plen_38_part_00
MSLCQNAGEMFSDKESRESKGERYRLENSSGGASMVT